MDAVQPALESRPSDLWMHLHQGLSISQMYAKRQSKLRTDTEVPILIELDTAGSDEEWPEKRVRETDACPKGGEREILHLLCPDRSIMQSLPGRTWEECNSVLMHILLLEMDADEPVWQANPPGPRG